MVTVYVLISLLDSTLYTGMTLDVANRLNEHNAGKSKYTKGHMPWQIIYQETQPDWATARLREKYLKSAAGKQWLYKQLNEDGGITGSLPA